MRELLKDREASRLDPMAELLLFWRRAPSWSNEVIRPALGGRASTSSATASATRASPTRASPAGLGADKVEALCDIATGGLWPDLTLLLRLHPEVAAERIAAEGRAADRFEGEGMELQRRVAEGYEEVAASPPRPRQGRRRIAATPTRSTPR